MYSDTSQNAPDSIDPAFRVPSWVLPLIVFSQFCGTSLWFASNGVLEDLTSTFQLEPSALGHLTSAVQFGFISGTLLFSLLTVADRFPPSRVFFLSALLGALANLIMVWEGNTFTTLLLLRFITGFFLAGIYPVGMKIASDYYQKGLGTSLGYLVGALVVGTAFPHLLSTGVLGIPWKTVLLITSATATLGGVAMWILPDGPFRRAMPKPEFTALIRVFRSRGFRSAAFGYFGHMWELYTFWAFVPLILKKYGDLNPKTDLPLALWSFVIIAVGGPACVLAGYISRQMGIKRVAAGALLLSGICCLLAPWMFSQLEPLFLVFLLIWGMVVIADSPLFSTLVAHNAIAERKGTALTIVTSIGFAITIVSIEAMGWLQERTDSPMAYLLLALGPLFGLISLNRNR